MVVCMDPLGKLVFRVRVEVILRKAKIPYTCVLHCCLLAYSLRPTFLILIIEAMAFNVSC